MSEADAATRLTLGLWHPNCWAIQATEKLPGGILAHAVYDSPMIGSKTVNGLFTAYGETDAEVSALIEHIESSQLTVSVNELHPSFDTRTQQIASVGTTREFFLEHDPTDMICPYLLEHGFVHSAPGKIEDGREYWDVRYAGERSEIKPEIEAICTATGADIEIARIGSVTGNSERSRRLDSLTQNQREVFELADELDRSKTTVLEHLRKAESKLLDP